MSDQLKQHPFESLLAVIGGGLWVWLIIHHPFIGLIVVVLAIAVGVGLFKHQQKNQ
ncbi:hypothetical protein [Lacticaseibacillus brantae]|uniref:Uncharacterized protein n=1 Tax=Lacticaseibacillus brantae DSM 23927 TaxID=1423727 RepID=A0A0R2B1E7_9LACO|nr:hypothetical protein [Lacticaseibacillus brantae]KRM71796.1 hypothetical protein FC34_GL001457 [Lacticaseibacillus brantae DSM 23927]